MKKSLKIIGISILILILFRGFIYRLAIKYDEIGDRTEIKITNQDLISQIERRSAKEKIDLEEIIKIANEITHEELKFTINRASRDPNVLINSNKANCIGYSTMFNSIANYLIRKYQLEQKIEANHKIGRITLLGIDIHQFFQSSFYHDHDFNKIIDLQTGKTILIDPSVDDYLHITEVASKS